jgi:hypothetical protein
MSRPNKVPEEKIVASVLLSLYPRLDATPYEETVTPRYIFCLDATFDEKTVTPYYLSRSNSTFDEKTVGSSHSSVTCPVLTKLLTGKQETLRAISQSLKHKRNTRNIIELGQTKT